MSGQTVEDEVIVNLSNNAIGEVKRRLEESDESVTGLRLGVKGGGCSGLSYIIDFGQKKEGDKVHTGYGFEVYLDPKSSLYLKDTQLDYQGGFMGSGFKFVNPNAENTCGCGESFSV